MEHLERTRDFDSAAAVEDTEQSLNFSPVAKYEENFSNVNGQFDESTRKLLRSRLLVSTATIFLFLLSIKVISITIHGISLGEFLSRLAAMIVLIGAWIYLFRHTNIKLTNLRRLEIATFVVPVAEALLVLVQEVQKRIGQEELEEVTTLFVHISFAIAILISIYGFYIPSNWKRIAIITSIVAVAPAVTALIHSWTIGISIQGYPEIVAVLMTITMSAVATLAAHIVQTVRRQATEAKQYGQYHLLEEIGAGGMGRVFRAKHRMLKRAAAIKLIRNEVSNSPEMIVEFEHEVQLSASLDHWNTVQVYDYGRTDDGEFYYVMEYLEGITLAQRIRHGKLNYIDTSFIIGQICDGLAEAHSKGMIHRDIKPANLFLTQIGDNKDVIKILDFGLAAMKTETMRLRKVSGTPAYMSPEQILSNTIDNRSDIYSLGLVIYECLVGHRLMVADSIQELLKMHTSIRPSLNEIPKQATGFADVVEKCIEKDPQKRFQSVTALKNAVRQLA